MLTDSKPPKPLRRIDYAERLKKNFAGVWIDRIASFGTFPLECMRSSTIPIALVPDIIPEYLVNENGDLKENTGVWTQDIYALPLLIGDVITKFLDDSIIDDVYDTMHEISLKYTQENSEKQLQKIYEDILNERISLFETSINNFEAQNNANIKEKVEEIDKKLKENK
jgi:hypothetical protein